MSFFYKKHFESVDSTSTYAKNNALHLSLPALITADEQFAGRGRWGNSFFSPKGTGLYMTLLIPAPENYELITPLTAVAVCTALESRGINPQIKWVNDIFLNGKKVCGILTELYIQNEMKYISIGVGINLTTDRFPEELASAGCIELDCVKSELAEEIAESVLMLIGRQDNEIILEEYRKRLFILGKEISYKKNNTEYSAVAVDINKNCNLIVRLSNGETDVLSSGEISIKF